MAINIGIIGKQAQAMYRVCKHCVFMQSTPYVEVYIKKNNNKKNPSHQKPKCMKL